MTFQFVSLRAACIKLRKHAPAAATPCAVQANTNRFVISVADLGKKLRDIYYAKYYGKGGGNGQLGKKLK